MTQPGLSMTAPQPTAHVLCGSIPIRSIPAPLPRSNLALELVSAASEAPARPISHNPRLRSSHTPGRRRSRSTSSSPSPFARPASARFRLEPSSPLPSSVRRPLGFTWSAWEAWEAAPPSLHHRHLPSDAVSPGARGQRGKRHRLPSIAGTSLPTPLPPFLPPAPPGRRGSAPPGRTCSAGLLQRPALPCRRSAL